MSERVSNERHLALLVEDEPEMAEEMEELLRVLGYEVVHTANLEEARGAVDEGQFCFVILDLQILPAPGAIKARVEAGHTLLQHVRSCYPGRNEADQHHLQVIVVSGHAKEHPEVVRAMQLGASDLLIKPLSANPRPLGDHIEDALRRSGRRDHESCTAIGRRAAASSPPDAQVVLRVVGTRDGRRTKVMVDERHVLVTDAELVVVLTLILARLEDSDRWVHKRDLGATDGYGYKGISRAAQALGMTGRGRAELYENDKQGGYRLHPRIDVGPIACDQLREHADARVRAMSNKIAKLIS